MQQPVLIQKAVLHGAGDLRLEEETFDLAGLKPTEIFVDTQVTGFSTGTDLGNYEGRSTEVPGAPDYPRAVGYSNVGVVRAVGDTVKSLHSGDRVFSMKPHRSGYVASESELLIKLPTGVDTDQASLGYLVNLGVASLRQVRYEAGESVCIIGLGVIGLCTVAIARAMGAYVSAVANHERRLKLATAMGAHESYLSGQFNPASVNADIVVLTANSWDAYRESMEAARYGGRITVLGFPGRAQPAPSFNPLDARWLYGKQLTITGAGHLPRVECNPVDIRFNLRRNLEFIFNLMAASNLNLAPAISHRFPFRQMKDAYDLAAAHSKDLSAAVFDWQ